MTERQLGHLRDYVSIDFFLMSKLDGAWVGDEVVWSNGRLTLTDLVDMLQRNIHMTLLFVSQEQLAEFLADPAVPADLRGFLSVIRAFPENVSALTLEECTSLLQLECPEASLPDDYLDNPDGAIHYLLDTPITFSPNDTLSLLMIDDHASYSYVEAMNNPLAMFHLQRDLRTRDLLRNPKRTIHQGFIESAFISTEGHDLYRSTPALTDIGYVLIRFAGAGTQGFVRGYTALGEIQFRDPVISGPPNGPAEIIEIPELPRPDSLDLHRPRPFAGRTVPLDVLVASEQPARDVSTRQPPTGE